MNFLLKSLSFIVALVVLVFVGAAVMVHFYLTDERVKDLIVPQAEKALGRTVTIGAIDIGLLSGITINNFAIKEKDQQKDFVKTESFELSYDLMPLFQKKLVVSEIRLNNPSINIRRNKQGEFNFDSLAILQGTKPTAKKQQVETIDKSSPAAMPIALTVDKITINKAALSLVDEKKEIPDTQMEANLGVSLDIGTTLESLKFKGKLDLTANSNYGELTPQAIIQATFDQQKVNYDTDITIDNEKLKLTGTIDQFQSKTPDILCNISSKQLDLDHLLALAGTLPKANKPQKASTEPARKTAADKTRPIAESIPGGLTIHGQVSVDQALYNKLTIDNFKLLYDLRNGILSVKELSADTAGGSLNSSTTVDLTTVDPSYKGSISVSSIDLQKLGKGLEQDFADIVSGSLQSTINFNGQGITPEVIKKFLSADASYNLNNGKIQNTPITRSIAGITGLNEFKDITFKDIKGDLKLLKGGKVNIISSMDGSDFGAETNGIADLDGNLELPVTLKLSQALSKKLDARGSITNFLTNEKGETELRLKIAGSFSSPKTSLDSAGVEEQVKKTIKAKAINELDRLLLRQQEKTDTHEGEEAPPPSPAETGINILKGFLGR